MVGPRDPHLVDEHTSIGCQSCEGQRDVVVDRADLPNLGPASQNRLIEGVHVVTASLAASLGRREGTGAPSGRPEASPWPFSRPRAR